MVKLYALLVPRDGMGIVDFHAHWRYEHGPLAAKIRRARGYVQSHALPLQPADLPVLPHGGSAEVYFDDVASADALMDDPDYANNAAHDEDNFHHMDRMTALRATQRVLLEGPPILRDTGNVKVMQFVRRPAGMDPDAFREQWLGDVVEDALTDDLRATRHVRAAAIAEDYAGGDPRFDGVRELWWPDVWAFMAARTRAPVAWAALTAAPAVDPAGSGFLVTAENRVVWPADGPPPV